MSERSSISLFAYLRLVLARAFEDFKWGRDLTIATAMALLTLLIQFYFGLPETYGERKILALSLIAPYVLVFGIHILWKIFTAPHKLYQGQEIQLIENSDSIIKAERKIKEIEEQGPEVMLTFFHNENSREYLGVLVHNTKGGTAHKIRVKAGTRDGLWSCDFGIVSYMIEGERLEIAPKTMITKGINFSFSGDPKFISFVRMYDQDMRTNATDPTALPVTATYENSLGTVFEQDFQIFFDKYAKGDGRAHTLKKGLRRVVRNTP